MYEFMKITEKLYKLLQDDLSRKLFWARMDCDLNPTIDTVFQPIKLMADGKKFEDNYWRGQFSKIKNSHGRLFLYGTGGMSGNIAHAIWKSNEDFFAFCSRNSERFTDGHLGKMVVDPQYLFEHKNESYVIISSNDYYAEIYDILVCRGFPQQHILSFSDCVEDILKIQQRQYFDFMDRFISGTAFIDGGCYDGRDTVRFLQHCKNDYSRIYAFEPDCVNFSLCKKNINAEKVDNVKIYNAGLGKKTSQMLFCAGHGQGSHIASLNDNTEEAESVKIMAIDDIEKESAIGFIKLDVEGAELETLYGAEETIKRDKPLLAVCVYHKQGDMLAIMKYLHELVPDYRFWIRHYSIFSSETVLYASVQ